MSYYNANSSNLAPQMPNKMNFNYPNSNNLNSLNSAQNANTRSILDFLVQDKLDALRDENQTLKNQISQANQNSFIAANQEAQTAELIRRLGRDCPVPAYIVPNPNCCYSAAYGYDSSGCGCGNCF